MINFPQTQLVSYPVPRSGISRFFSRQTHRTFVISEQMLGSCEGLWAIDGYFSLANEEADLSKKQMATIVAQSTNLWKHKASHPFFDTLELLLTAALWKLGGRALFAAYLCARLDRETLQKLARVVYSLSGYDYFVESVTLMRIKK